MLIPLYFAAKVGEDVSETVELDKNQTLKQLEDMPSMIGVSRL